MSTVRRGLGSGISALLGNTNNVLSSEDSNGLQEISIDKIIANIDQPRKTFDEESLSELANSIKEFGILQPILVAKENDNYIIIAGERRYRAGKIAGLSVIPAIILKNRNLEDHYKISILENIQRENLNPVEEAQAYQFLIDNFGYTHEIIAEKVSKSRSYITNALRMLKLPEEALIKISEGEITSGHAKVLSGLKEQDIIKEAIAHIEDENMSVRDLEVYVKEKKETKKTESTPSEKIRKKIITIMQNDASQFDKNFALNDIATEIGFLTGYNTQITDNGRAIFMNIEIGNVNNLAKMVDLILKNFNNK